MASGSVSYSMATKIRIELSRVPPSQFKSKAPLDEGQIAERRAKLAAYESGKKRQQNSKFGRLLAAAEGASTAACREGVATRAEVHKAEKNIKEHVTAEIQMLRSEPRSQGTTYHVDHAAIRTNLERGGFTAAQLLSLHRAANLKPPMRVNAAGVPVPEKAKYQLAQSLCSAAGSGQHAIQNSCGSSAGSERQVLDYETLGAWMEALRHQRPPAEWEPPVYAPLVAPPPPKRRRKAEPKQSTAAEGPAALGTTGEVLSADAGLPAPPAPARDGSSRAPRNLLTNYFRVTEDLQQPDTPKAASKSASLGELYQECVPGAPPPARGGSSHTRAPRQHGCDIAGSMKLTDLQSATCSTISGPTSGATSPTASPTASAANESQDGAPVDCAPAEDAALPRASGAAASPRPPKASAINHKLGHTDAIEVHDVQGKFSHWAPLTVEGLCGHPCANGKLCSAGAESCSKHRRREQSLMEGEDERAAVMERGVCGVPLGPDSACQRPKGRCSVHTPDWHQKREIRSM